jgi:hypothetical protein
VPGPDVLLHDSAVLCSVHTAGCACSRLRAEGASSLVEQEADEQALETILPYTLMLKRLGAAMHAGRELV